MKALLIDPDKKTITEVDYTEGAEGLTEMYKILGCSTVEIPIFYDNGDMMFADEEGWLTYDAKPEIRCGFAFNDWSYGILGKVLIVGGDEDENIIDVQTTKESLLENIYWLDEAFMRRQGKQMGVIT